MKKESIWNKKYMDWTLKDGLIVSLIGGLIVLLPAMLGEICYKFKK